jgi:hypothetical protein
MKIGCGDLLRGADSYSAATLNSIVAEAEPEFQSKVSMACIVNGRLREKQKASSPFRDLLAWDINILLGLTP